jgi:hypothetical protein
MEICDNPSCKVWLHEECLIDDILTKTYQRLVNNSVETEVSTNGTSKANGKKSKGKPYKGLFSAKIDAENGHTSVTIKDLRPIAKPQSWVESVACLKCGSVLE